MVPLYMKFNGPLAKCLGPVQMDYVMHYVMQKVHEGNCDNYSEDKSHQSWILLVSDGGIYAGIHKKM